METCGSGCRDFVADLEPSLVAARAAWEPYRAAAAAVEDGLGNQLRSAMWHANHDAMSVGFGHRHASRRRAKNATSRVDEAEARIAAMYAGASDIKQRLDAVEAEARNLHDRAYSSGRFGLDDFHREQVHELDRLLDALEVWTMWARGRSVAVAKLVDSAGILAEAARRAPLCARNPGETDGCQWTELLDRLSGLLHQLGVDLSMESPGLEHAGLELDLEL